MGLQQHILYGSIGSIFYIGLWQHIYMGLKQYIFIWGLCSIFYIGLWQYILYKFTAVYFIWVYGSIFSMVYGSIIFYGSMAAYSIWVYGSIFYMGLWQYNFLWVYGKLDPSASCLFDGTEGDEEALGSVTHVIQEPPTISAMYANVANS